MPKWTVDLIGDQADLEALAALGGGVVRDGANFVFQSADLDTLTEARAVEQALVHRIEVLKGLLRVMTEEREFPLDRGEEGSESVHHTFPPLGHTSVGGRG